MYIWVYSGFPIACGQRPDSECCKPHQTNLKHGVTDLRIVTNITIFNKMCNSIVLHVVSWQYCHRNDVNDNVLSIFSPSHKIWISLILMYYYKSKNVFNEKILYVESRSSWMPLEDQISPELCCSWPQEATSLNWLYLESTWVPHCCDKNNESKKEVGDEGKENTK